MKTHFVPYLTIPCLAFLVVTTTVQGKDKDHKGKHKNERKDHYKDWENDNRGYKRTTSIYRKSNIVVVRPTVRVGDGRLDQRHYERIDYRNDRHFDYRDSNRDVSYRTRYPRRVVVYEDRSYGYNYYDMQVVLLREGYYNGAIDGVWGPASRRALVRYQSDQGWRNDDVVDGRFIVNFGIGY